jgi:hypothetical protein
MFTPRAEAIMSMAPASIQIVIGKTNPAEHARLACTHPAFAARARAAHGENCKRR